MKRIRSILSAVMFLVGIYFLQFAYWIHKDTVLSIGEEMIRRMKSDKDIMRILKFL